MYIYWTEMSWHDWQMFLASTDEGLCYIGSPNASFSELEAWVQKHFANYTITKENSFLKDATSAIQAYLDGEKKSLPLSLHITGTPFQRMVWQGMREVPYGETATYSDLAEKIGRPTAVRAVATAVGANPLLIALPCHRIIAKDGSLAGFRGGLLMKRKLLEIEEEHR